MFGSSDSVGQLQNSLVVVLSCWDEMLGCLVLVWGVGSWRWVLVVGLGCWELALGFGCCFGVLGVDLRCL